VIPEAVVERAMKVQKVILRAIAKRITWWQAAEIIGISDRQMRRWRRTYLAPIRICTGGVIDQSNTPWINEPSSNRHDSLGALPGRIRSRRIRARS
jgi:hypothetical protein